MARMVAIPVFLITLAAASAAAIALPSGGGASEVAGTARHPGRRPRRQRSRNARGARSRRREGFRGQLTSRNRSPRRGPWASATMNLSNDPEPLHPCSLTRCLASARSSASVRSSGGGLCGDVPLALLSNLALLLEVAHHPVDVVGLDAHLLRDLGRGDARIRPHLLDRLVRPR
jgi:hypothetical protein